MGSHEIPFAQVLLFQTIVLSLVSNNLLLDLSDGHKPLLTHFIQNGSVYEVHIQCVS
jgi:hypothetical protein